MQASAEKASVVEAEPPKAEPVAPAVGPKPEEPAAAAGGPEGSAAKPEGRKRGRPKKAESEGKAEKKTESRQGRGRSRCLTFNFLPRFSESLARKTFFWIDEELIELMGFKMIKERISSDNSDFNILFCSSFLQQ